MSQPPETEFSRHTGPGGDYGVWQPPGGRPVVLGSRFNPGDHARRVVNAALTHPQQALVVVSPGVSGLAQEAARQRPGHVLLVDLPGPPLEWFQRAHPKGLTGATLWVSPDAEALRDWLLGQVAPGAPPPAVVWAHPDLASHPAYAPIAAALDDAVKLAHSQSLTLRQAGRLYLQNLLDNAPLLARAGGLNEWMDCLKGRPVLLCGAGPSLARAAPLLKERPDLPVLAVDMAFKPLAQMGRRPDALVSADPFLPNLLKIHPERNVTTPLVISALACPGVSARFTGPAYVFLPYGPFRKALGLEGQPTLEGAGAVGSHLLHLGLMSGADPLILAGLDFCFLDHQTYAPGAPGELARAGVPAAATMRVATLQGGEAPTLPAYHDAVTAIEHLLGQHVAPPALLNLGRGAKFGHAVAAEAQALANTLLPQPPWFPPAPVCQKEQWRRVLGQALPTLQQLAQKMLRYPQPNDRLCAQLDQQPLLHEGLGQTTWALSGQSQAAWQAMTDYTTEVAWHMEQAIGALER